MRIAGVRRRRPALHLHVAVIHGRGRGRAARRRRDPRAGRRQEPRSEWMARPFERRPGRALHGRSVLVPGRRRLPGPASWPVREWGVLWTFLVFLVRWVQDTTTSRNMPASMWNIRWQCHAQRPSASAVTRKLMRCAGCTGRVAARKEATVGAFQLAPHAVQVHGMGHHGVVVQNDPQPLAVFEVHRRGLSELQPVQGPCVAFHVAREVQFDPGRASCPAAPTGMQIREGQHAPTVVAQSDAGVIEVGARHVNAHVRAGTILGASVASSSAGHGQSPPPRRVGCDPSPCHRGSWRRDSCPPSPHDPSRTSNPSPSRSSRSCPSCPSSRSSPWPGRTRHGPCPHHAAHHVVHGQPFDRIEGRHGSLKTFTHGQRGTRVACPVHRLGEDRKRHPVAGRSRRRFRQDRIGTHRRSPAPRQHHRRTTVSFSPGMRTSKVLPAR